MRTGNRWRFFTQTVAMLLATLTFAVLPALARSRKDKLSRELHSVNRNSVIDVVVQFSKAPSGEKYKKLAGLGGTLKTDLPNIHGVALHLPASALANLAKDPDLVYITSDRPVRSFLANAAPAINAPYAWSFGYDGTGIGVAVVDSGITGHDDLKDSSGHNRVVYNANFASDSGTNDVYGHGEHVAGIVGGSGKDSICSNCFSVIKGIAPNSTLINLRALDKNGQGTDSSVIAAINKAIQLKSTYNIRVLNLSVGRPVYESYAQDPLCQAVESAWKAGIVVVVAAGNYGRDNSVGENGYGTITAPGNDPYVITVGAMKTMGTPDRSDDRMASYSSKGPTGIDHVLKPDLVAPGNVMTSLQTGANLEKLYPSNRALRGSYQSGQTGYSDKYFVLSGTSMAAPVVSGAVADLL